MVSTVIDAIFDFSRSAGTKEDPDVLKMQVLLVSEVSSRLPKCGFAQNRSIHGKADLSIAEDWQPA